MFQLSLLAKSTFVFISGTAKVGNLGAQGSGGKEGATGGGVTRRVSVYSVQLSNRRAWLMTQQEEEVVVLPVCWGELTPALRGHVAADSCLSM